MQNLEAKFKLDDLERAGKQPEAIGYRFKATLLQCDTFFRVARRQAEAARRGVRRVDDFLRTSGQPRSQAQQLRNRVRSLNRKRFRDMMTRALGTIATVKKTRILMMRDHIRLHLDRVDGLGEFGEIEAVLGEHGDRRSVAARRLTNFFAPRASTATT